MKLHIIFTGGTIGSTVKYGIAAPDPAAAAALPAACPSEFTKSVSFDSETPYYILSETLSARHLNLLTESVSRALRADYDGILITHGSDTIAYTAAALDLMFADSRCPIVLICSNYPLDDPRANGIANFEAALAFLQQMPGAAGAYVSCRNRPDDPVNLHKGTRLLGYTEGSDRLFSLQDKPYAIFRSGIIEQGEAAPAPAHPIPVPAGRTALFEFSGILRVSCAPGVLYPVPPEDTRAVLLTPYHCGTLPADDPALTHFCAICRSRHLPIFVPAAENETFYASSSAFEALGITLLPDAGPAAYMRLWIAMQS